MRARAFVLTISALCSTLLVEGIGVRAAHAEPEPDKMAPGFELLASVGYGASTSDVGKVELDPFALGLGLDLGYVWRSGFRLGADFGYGFGRSITQTRDGLLTGEQKLTTDVSSATGALSVGYDVPISVFKLRYALDVGAIVMRSDRADSEWSFLIAPGGALLWQRGILELGLGFEYLIPSSDAVPTGFTGELVGGVKW